MRRRVLTVAALITLAGSVCAETITTTVNGMVCAFCATGIEKTFQEIIGRPLAEFVQLGTEHEENLARRAMAGFEERRHWTGVVQVRLKNQSSPFYFDCVAHAMLRGDTVSGITILARDVSALRRN